MLLCFLLLAVMLCVGLITSRLLPQLSVLYCTICKKASGMKLVITSSSEFF